MNDEQDGANSEPEGPGELSASESPAADDTPESTDDAVSRPVQPTRPTGKRRTPSTAGSSPGRPVNAVEGSKRASGRSTARRTEAEAPVKQNLITRITRFLREVVAELRKVIWPTRKELITYTTVVLTFVTFMVAVVAGLDLLFAKGVLAVFG